MERTNLMRPALSALLLGTGIATAVIGGSLGIWVLAFYLLSQLLL